MDLDHTALGHSGWIEVTLFWLAPVWAVQPVLRESANNYIQSFESASVLCFRHNA